MCVACCQELYSDRVYDLLAEPDAHERGSTPTTEERVSRCAPRRNSASTSLRKCRPRCRSVADVVRLLDLGNVNRQIAGSVLQRASQHTAYIFTLQYFDAAGE